MMCSRSLGVFMDSFEKTRSQRRHSGSSGLVGEGMKPNLRYKSSEYFLVFFFLGVGGPNEVVAGGGDA